MTRKHTVILMAAVAALSLGACAAEPRPGFDTGHPRHGGMFKIMDKNHDGVVTRTEADAFHTKMFDQMDKNHDGKLTMDETMAPMHGKQCDKRGMR